MKTQQMNLQYYKNRQNFKNHQLPRHNFVEDKELPENLQHEQWAAAYAAPHIAL
jgi:hypothetical protein